MVAELRNGKGGIDGLSCVTLGLSLLAGRSIDSDTTFCR